MKSIFLFFACIVAIGCGSEKEEIEHRGYIDVTTSELRIDNSEIISIIKEFITSNSDVPSRVYTMVVSRENFFTTTFSLSSIATYSELNELTPSGYFVIDNDMILVYTGMERLRKRDEQFIEQLRDLIGNRLEDDLLNEGSGVVFDPSSWKIKLIQDSVVVERGGFNLLGPPVVEKIKYLNPK